jgi:hypothetical protein
MSQKAAALALWLMATAKAFCLLKLFPPGLKLKEIILAINEVKMSHSLSLWLRHEAIRSYNEP